MAKRRKKPAARPAETIGMDHEWRAKDDMHTLLRAEEIRGDKSRHSAAQGAARKHMRELASVVSPRAARRKRLNDVDFGTAARD